MRAYRDSPNENRERAIRMITDPVYTMAYINTVLSPLVKELSSSKMDRQGTPYSAAVLAYDILNEPEGTSWDSRLYSNYK
jgi:hypothetical protein